MKLQEIYAPISDELKTVHVLIQDALEKTPLKPLREINQYIIANPGKRLRPTLAILAFKAVAASGLSDKKILETAASLELIHMASLIHDDIIDKADLRHNKPSVNAKWGAEIAIPMGVYLYSISLQFMASVGSVTVLRHVSHTVKHLCEGEMTQIFERDNVQLNILKYLVILKKKTAVLFGAACYSGGLLAGADKKTCFKLKAFGYNLGMVFQIIDDYLDIMGETKKLGKASGQDFFLGEFTLPMLYLIDASSDSEKQEVLEMVASKDLTILPTLQTRLIESHALERTKKLALTYLDKARETLSEMSESPYKQALMDLTYFISTRGFEA